MSRNSLLETFILKRIHDMIATYTQMLRTDKYPQNSSIIWPVWLNGWVLVYKLSVCRFQSRCRHLNFRHRACFKQKVIWYSGNYNVWNHSETRTRHGKNIQLNAPYMFSQHGSAIWTVWLNGWVFVYEISGCWFKSGCSHLDDRYRACFY